MSQPPRVLGPPFRRLARTLPRRSDFAAAGAEPVCVCAFCDALGLKQPTASYHLKQLVDAGLLEREARGTYAYYRLAPNALERVAGLLSTPPELADAV